MENFKFETVSLDKEDYLSGVMYSYFIEDPITKQKLKVVSVYRSNTKTLIEKGKKYLDNRYFTIKADNNNCKRIPENILDRIFQEAFMYVLSNEYLVEVLEDDTVLQKYINRFEDKQLVKDIDLIALDGGYDVNEEVLCKFIEKPVRKACTDLTNAGIKTIMSSCNKKNMYNPTIKEKELLFIGHYDKTLDPWPIGNGYGWIMIDWEELNDQNKAYLLGLHDGIISSPLNTKEQSRLAKISNGKQDNLVKFYEYKRVDEFLNVLLEGEPEESRNRLLLTLNPKPIEKDNNFDSRSKAMYGCNSLNMYGSHFRVVVLRYPVDERTTIEEVEKYYDKLVKTLVQNQPKIEKNQEKILEYI